MKHLAINTDQTAAYFLKKYWNHENFRPLQEEIITSVVEGNDALALLPTGGGKSICYQIPALMNDGLCLVISPLLSLMADQVDQLKQRKIKALAINSFMSKSQIDHALDNAIYGDFKLLYVSPERLQSDLFIERFKKMSINLIAVDEAHCISQWGYDFRPSYLQISDLRALRPEIPILALTATATHHVVSDIQNHLTIEEGKLFSQSFARDNLAIKILKTDDKRFQLKRFLKTNNKGSSIVYVRNRKKCAELAELLSSTGLHTSFYHAGLSKEERAKRQNEWNESDSMCMVATNAFGMGIDKANVYKVVHYDLPESIEAYYQEIGRAGRDGKSSEAITLYSNSDILRLEKNFKLSFPDEKQVQFLYEKLCNHFQVAIGEGKEENFIVDFQEFVDKYDLIKGRAYVALNQLHHEGWISLSEGLTQPSLIKITADRSILMRNDLPRNVDGIMQYLLRAHSGILDGDCVISESNISKNLNISRKEVDQILDYLVKADMIDYKASTGLPVITYLKDRIPSSKLKLSPSYRKRKQAYKDRIDAITSLMSDSDVCRMLRILEYFGEKHSEICGKCDVCAPLKSELTSAEQKQLKNNILSMLDSKGPIEIAELKQGFPGIHPDLVVELCRKMMDDGFLRIEGLTIHLIEKPKS